MCISIWNKIVFSLILWGTVFLTGCGGQGSFSVSDPSQTRQDAIEVSQVGVDLLPVDALVTGGFAMPGTKVKVSVSIANQGDSPAVASHMRYYLSTDTHYDDGDKYLNYDKVSALAPAEVGDENANVRIPADWPEGEAYILFIADVKAAVVETDETNNTTFARITVGAEPPAAEGDAPDLRIQDVSLESLGVEAGEILSVHATVINGGNTEADSSRLKYYLSTDSIFDSSDKYLNYDKVDALAVGATSAESANLRIPAAITDGSWYILFVADANIELAEQNESNNTHATLITVGELAGGVPDLRITESSLGLPAVQAGDVLPVQSTIENIGSGGALATQLQYFLSRDVVLDEYDKQVSFDNIEPLGLGGSRVESADLRITANTTGGIWYVILVLDWDNNVVEEDETNNQLALAVEVLVDSPDAVKPDFIGENVTLSAAAGLAGEQIAVTVDVRNIGPLAADVASRLKYYLSTDDVFDPADKYLNYDSVPALDIQGVSSEGANLRIPSETADGNYFFIFVVDDTNVIDEQFETNNALAVPVGVGVEAVAALSEGDDEPELADAADLVIEDLVVTVGEFAPGQKVPVTLNVANRGVADADESRIKYYVSRDTVYDSNDRYGGYDRVDALSVDEVGAESGNPRVPADATGGVWYVLVVADANNDIHEQEEENNVTAVPFMVNVDNPDAELADIIVHDVVISDVYVAPNAKIDVSLSLTNAGVLDAVATRAKFYLSPDEHYDATDLYLEYQDAPALAVGDMTMVDASLRIPHGTEQGTWYLLVFADVNGAVEEQYESNNISPHVLTVDPSGVSSEGYAFNCVDYVTTDSSILSRNTIASMNVLHMGWDNSKDFTALACVLSHFNITALNEVENEEAVQTLVSSLETLTTLDWGYHISEHAVGNAAGMEYYAFVWREDTVSFLEPVGFFDDPEDVIKREPYGANFQMGEFDFTLVAFHQRCGKTLAVRRAEANHFAQIIEYFQNANGDENDVLVGGDFNLPGDDYSFTAVGWNGVTYSVDPEQATSISAEGLRNSFDNIFYQSQYTTELVNHGVLDFTKGNQATLRRTVSDHIPVWIEVDTSVDDD